jgi:hypothetical protein
MYRVIFTLAPSLTRWSINTWARDAEDAKAQCLARYPEATDLETKYVAISEGS